MIKCSKVEWVAHATCTEYSSYKISAKNPKGQALRRWKDNDWIHLAQDRGMWLVHMNTAMK
jgi:hypothetical protein